MWRSHAVDSIWPRAAETRVFGFGNVSKPTRTSPHHQLALFTLDNEEENDFACAAVLTTHTQDVKQLKWHPQKDVRTPATCLHQRH